MARSTERRITVSDKEYDALREQILSYCAKNGGYLASDLSSAGLLVELTEALEGNDRLFLCSRYSDLATVWNEIWPERNIFSCSFSYAFGRTLLRDREETGEKIFIFLDSRDLADTNLDVLKLISSYEGQLVLIVHEYQNQTPRSALLKKGLSALGNTSAYTGLKKGIKGSLSNLKHGDQIIQTIHEAKTKVKRTVWNEGIFRQLSLDYYGPYNGNDRKEIAASLSSSLSQEHPVLLHYRSEERDLPQKYSDLLKKPYVEPFDLNTGKPKLEETASWKKASSFTEECLIELFQNEKDWRFYDHGTEAFRSLSASFADRYLRYDLSFRDLLELAIGSSSEKEGTALRGDIRELCGCIELLNKEREKIKGRFLLCIENTEGSDLSELSALKDTLVYSAGNHEDICRFFMQRSRNNGLSVLICPDLYLDRQEYSDEEKILLGKWPVFANHKTGGTAVICDGPDFDTLKKTVIANDADLDLYRIDILVPFSETELSRILDSYAKVLVYHSSLERLIRDQIDSQRKASVVQYLGKEEFDLIFRNGKEC